MFIVRNGRALELTNAELYNAYCEYSLALNMNKMSKKVLAGNLQYPEEFLNDQDVLRALVYKTTSLRIEYDMEADEATQAALDIFMPLLYTKKWLPEHGIDANDLQPANSDDNNNNNDGNTTDPTEPVNPGDTANTANTENTGNQDDTGNADTTEG